MGLTAKQQRFVEEYLKDLNGTQAAIRAGYREKAARAQASLLLTKQDIKAAVEAAKSARKRKSGISAQWVLKKIRRTIERCSTGDDFDAANALRGLELLGRHLGMWEKHRDMDDDTRVAAQKALIEQLLRDRGQP